MQLAFSLVMVASLATRGFCIPPTRTGKLAARELVPRAATTTFPNAAGTSTFPTPIKVSGTFDGRMYRYDRNTNLCTDSNSETGEGSAIFVLENGATLQNVIIGRNQAEGVHCKGTCTLRNVWWEDVCEDAATFKQNSGTSYVIGGGARSAGDKIFQHNGFGTISIQDFFANSYGKLYRSCGNCKTNGGSRHVIIDGVVGTSGGVLAGINTNYGDTATIRNTCAKNGKFCELYTGNNSGKEPTKIGSSPDGNFCKASNTRTNC